MDTVLYRLYHAAHHSCQVAAVPFTFPSKCAGTEHRLWFRQDCCLGLARETLKGPVLPKSGPGSRQILANVAAKASEHVGARPSPSQEQSCAEQRNCNEGRLRDGYSDNLSDPVLDATVTASGLERNRQCERRAVCGHAGRSESYIRAGAAHA